MEDKIFKMLPVNEQIIDIIKQLIERCYKYESQFFETAADRNICEAELRDIYDTVDSVMSDLDLTEREEFEEEIENLEADIDDLKDYNDGLREEIQILQNDNADLIDRNYDLKQENDKLREILNTVSKAVNDTWC
jgi:FtsZ-binding cell division protein ZapB